VRLRGAGGSRRAARGAAARRGLRLHADDDQTRDEEKSESKEPESLHVFPLD
jgi:hypothetical protein